MTEPSQTSSRDEAASLLPFSGTLGYRLGRRLPDTIKCFVLRCYWCMKALKEDWQEYSAELVGYVPSHTIRLWWYRHFCRMRLGSNSSIHRQCRMYHPFRIRIGDHCVINRGVLLDGRQGLFIGDNVSISEGTVILTLGHDVDAPDFALKGAPVVIEDNVFVGSYARLLPGVTIGEGAVVAVGAVVTNSVAPYSVVGGVPARYLRDRVRNLTYRLQHRKRFG